MDRTKTELLHLREEDFDREVLRSEIPAVVDFYADWCGPCRMVSPIIDSLSKEYAGKVKFVKVNTDDNQSLAARYDIMSIPTVMVFKSGRMIDKIVGAATPQMYRKKVDSALGS